MIPSVLSGPAAKDSAPKRRVAAPPDTSNWPLISLIVLVLALVGSGLVTHLSASAVVSMTEEGSPWSQFVLQGLYVSVGLLLMFPLMRLDYRRLRVLTWPAILVTLILLVLPLMPNIGVTKNNASRWIEFGSITVQPSELAKLTLILIIADVLSRPSRNMHDMRATLMPVLLVTGLFCGLVIMQPHLGNTLVLAAIALFMLFWAGSRIRHLLAIILVLGASAVFLVWNTPWRRERLFAVFDPLSDPNDTTYQLLNSLYSISSGGIGGAGPGQGLGKWGFVPYAHSDFIFSVVAEEQGLIGAVTVVLLFGGLIGLGYFVAVRAADRHAMLLAIGITSYMFVQVFLNLGSVLGILPTVGVTLPLLSHGGSSIIMTLAALGILLNVARQTPQRMHKIR